jgi:hypothetical protein
VLRRRNRQGSGGEACPRVDFGSWWRLIDLAWDQSTDDLDPQWVIKYNVYVDGVLTDVVVGTGEASCMAISVRTRLRLKRSIRRGTNPRRRLLPS